eukprot:365524-Chlamydomonas_euryale.AAC.7
MEAHGMSLSHAPKCTTALLQPPGSFLHSFRRNCHHGERVQTLRTTCRRQVLGGAGRPSCRAARPFWGWCGWSAWDCHIIHCDSLRFHYALEPRWCNPYKMTRSVLAAKTASGGRAISVAAASLGNAALANEPKQGGTSHNE